VVRNNTHKGHLSVDSLPRETILFSDRRSVGVAGRQGIIEPALSDIAENAADMERPLSIPPSHVEEAGGRDEIASTTSHSDIRGLLGAEPHDRAPS